MYGAFAVGGMVTIGPDVEVEDEDVESVVVETDDVLLSLEVEVVEEDDEEDVVVVDSMVVEVVDEEEVVLEVDLVDDVDEEEDEVVLVLEVLSVVEGSAVVWAASFVAEVVFASPAGSATTRVAMASSSTKRRMNDGWGFPSPRRESLMVFSCPCPLVEYVNESAVLHSGSAGVVGDQERECRDEGIDEVDISALLRVGLEW